MSYNFQKYLRENLRRVFDYILQEQATDTPADIPGDIIIPKNPLEIPTDDKKPIITPGEEVDCIGEYCIDPVIRPDCPPNCCPGFDGPCNIDPDTIQEICFMTVSGMECIMVVNSPFPGIFFILQCDADGNCIIIGIGMFVEVPPGSGNWVQVWQLNPIPDGWNYECQGEHCGLWLDHPYFGEGYYDDQGNFHPIEWLRNNPDYPKGLYMRNGV